MTFTTITTTPTEYDAEEMDERSGRLLIARRGTLEPLNIEPGPRLLRSVLAAGRSSTGDRQWPTGGPSARTRREP